MNVTKSSSPSLELTLTKRRANVHIHDDRVGTSDEESTHQLLKRICDLLETRIRCEEEQHREDDKENGMKRDWILAAAVLDRICAVAIAATFFGGTVVIFAVCITQL